MIRKGIRPAFRFGFDKPFEEEGFRREYPFRKSWGAVAFLLVVDAIFLYPAYSSFQALLSAHSDGIDSLFDLVTVLFLGAWLMGWMLAPLGITSLILLMLFGREVARVAPGVIEIGIGLPFVGLTLSYDLAKLRNLRVEQPAPNSGRSWRGTHVTFDYGANSAAFGSDIGLQDLGEIESAIKSVTGKRPRRGDAVPHELEELWDADANNDEGEEIAASPVVVGSPEGRLTLSVLALIAANLIPVAGAVFLEWELSDVMVLYWAESAIIGLFNIAKIAVTGRWAALFAGPFFAGHFGGFMAIHFLFIYTIFVEGLQGSGPSGNLSNVADLFIGLWPALLALALSHGYSFFANFIGKKEYRVKTIKTLMSEPYSRIIFMHLVLIFGGGLAMVLGEPTIVILIVIALKIILDVRAHVKQRGSAKQGAN